MSGGNLERVLRLMAEKKASDVFLSAKTPILIKINGQIMQLTDQVLTPSQPRQLLAEMISPTQMEELDETGELNMGITIPGVAIFRLSAFNSRANVEEAIARIAIVDRRSREVGGPDVAPEMAALL